MKKIFFSLLLCFCLVPMLAQSGLNKLSLLVTDNIPSFVYDDSTGHWQIGPGKIYDIQVFYLKNLEHPEMDIKFLGTSHGFILNSGDIMLADNLLQRKVENGGLSLLPLVTKQFYVSVGGIMWQILPRDVYGIKIVEFQNLSTKKIINFKVDHNKFWNINKNDGVKISEVINVLNKAKSDKLF